MKKQTLDGFTLVTFNEPTAYKILDTINAELADTRKNSNYARILYSRYYNYPIKMNKTLKRYLLRPRHLTHTFIDSNGKRKQETMYQRGYYIELVTQDNGMLVRTDNVDKAVGFIYQIKKPYKVPDFRDVIRKFNNFNKNVDTKFNKV